MNSATCQALRQFLNEEIEAEEAIDWDEEDMPEDMPEDIREHNVKVTELRILRLNQLLDLVHAAYQEAD